MFSPWTAGILNFWVALALATAVLSASAIIIEGKRFRARFRFTALYIVVGVISAALLYGAFFAGGMAVESLFESAGGEIARIYESKAEGSPLLIFFLLLLWIGPAQAIFWRGFIQHRLSLTFGGLAGLIVASLFEAVIHLWALNLMLFLAALVSGFFWGAMYYKFKSVWPGLISHAVWDAAIFVVWPIT